jgi:hypothetical protein
VTGSCWTGYGVVGGSDIHNGLSTSDEGAVASGSSGLDPNTMLPRGDAAKNALGIIKHTSRIDFDPKMIDSGDWVSKAYAEGVAMGSDLPAKPVSAGAPTFVFQAVKDPDGANLDRIQVIKLWLDGSGYKEKLFDVALSSNRKDDPETGRAVPVGNTVNLKTGTYRNTIGAAVLTAVWQDPEFDPTKLPSTMRARWRFRRRAGARSSPSKTICQFQRVCRQLFRNAPGRHPSGSRRPVNPRVNDTRIGRGILHGRS